MSKKLFGKFFLFLLVVGLLFAAAPTGQAIAQTGGTTLNVANWSATASVGLTGRPSVLVDGTTYHMWHGNGTSIFHTTSTTADFASPTTATATFTVGAPFELETVTVIKETDGFKMIAYGSTVKEFALYTSSDGTVWTKDATVFSGAGLPYGWLKVDAPFLLPDGTGYKLYFQVKETDTDYGIYMATSPTIGGTYILANSNNPVLTPETGETRIFHPTVVKDGSQYYLWYATQNTQKMGLAKSADGITWTKSPANPIIDGEAGSFAEPSVVKVGDTWHLYYMGSSVTGVVQHVSATGPFEFQTIQAAINAAAPGDTIQVAAGTYVEQLLIQKNLILVGAGIGQTIVQAPTTGRVTAPGYTSQVWTADNWNTDYLLAAYPTDPISGTPISVKVTGFTFDANSQAHIVGDRFTGVYFRKVFNADIAQAGLFASEIKGFSASDPSVTGIRVLESSQLTLSGNQVKNYTILGIVVYGTDNLTDPIVTTSGNTLVPASSSVQGIQYRYVNKDSNYSGTISGNTITGGAIPIAASYSDHILIDGNIINDSVDVGIWMEESSNCTIQNNSITNFVSNGIHAVGDKHIVKSNTISDTTGTSSNGIVVSKTSGTLVSGNTISGIHSGDTTSLGSCGWGIGVDIGYGAVTNTILENNTVTGSDAGVVFWNVDGTNVAHNNSLTGNSPYDLGNSSTTVTIDATKNWWGSATGPASGKISGDVNYTPWYATATTTPTREFVQVLRAGTVVALSDTIQAAIDAASAGDTILVGPGTYNENITINKANITLQSTGTAEETIINANGGFGVYILKDLGIVTIDGFTVEGWLTSGIVQGTANRSGTTSRILNNIVVGETGDVNHGNCIQVTGDNSLVQGNTVTGAYYIGTGPYGASGILIYAANNAIVRNNTVSGADIGISVAAGGYHSLGPITGVKVEGNDVSGSEIGIGVTFNANNTVITGNNVHGNLTGLYEEFMLNLGPTGTEATLNKLVDNQEQAVVGSSDETVIPANHSFLASPNWWGSAAGPDAGQIIGNVEYIPWCADEECETLAPVFDDYYETAEETMLVVEEEDGVLKNEIGVDGISGINVVELENGVTHGNLTLNEDGSFSYMPDADFFGEDSFTYIVSVDDEFIFIPATVTITVTNVKDQVDAVNDSYTTNEDTTLTIEAPGVLANDIDVDNNIRAASLVTDVQHGTLSLLGDGSFTYVPDPDFTGTDSFIYQLVTYPEAPALQSLWTDEATVTITVTPVNDAPVAHSRTANTLEETRVDITLSASDVDGDPLTYAIVAGPAHGTVTLNGNIAAYIPAFNYVGTDSFTFRVNDGYAYSNTATVTITINPVDDAPVLGLIEDATIPELVEFSFTATATDVDLPAQVLTFSLVDAPDGAAIDAETGVFTWTPSEEQGAGVYTFTVKVCDDTDPTPLCDAQEVTLTVTEVNTAPVAQDLTATTLEDTSVDVTLVATDVDIPVQGLTYEIVDEPAHGEVTLAGNKATYTPALNFNGEDSFTYKANDGLVDSNVATVTITVTPVNDWPIANDDFYEVLTGTELVKDSAEGVLANDVLLDPDEEVSIQILEEPQHGTLSMEDDGSFTYMPEAGYMGTDTFRYLVLSVQVGINAEWSDDALVTITVKPYMRLFLPIILR